MLTVALLLVSNVFMTFAWYGHLRHRSAPIVTIVLLSWLIALGEYCFQVPANRLGSQAGISTAQLKTMQELITLVVFVAFMTIYLGEPLRWNHGVGFALIALGAAFVFKPF